MAINKRIKVMGRHGKVVKEFDSIKACAREYKLQPATIMYRLRTDRYFNEEYFEFVDPSYTDGAYKKKTIYAVDRKEIDRKNYRIINYEVRNQRECVTPCTIKSIPRPFVGSAACANCKYFKGRNRLTHEVACAYRTKR